MSRTLQDDRRQPFMWLNLEFDDLPLDPYAVRIYIHILRRAGHGGQCWESIDHIAAHCMISTGSVKKALRTLIQAGMIKRASRTGGTSLYSISDISNWTIQPVDRSLDLDTTQPGSKTTQVTTDPGVDTTRPRGWICGDPGGGSVVTHKERSLEERSRELDPPNKTRARAENFQNLEPPIDPPLEPEPQPQPIDPEIEPLEPEPIGCDSSQSAIIPVKNPIPERDPSSAPLFLDEKLFSADPMEVLMVQVPANLLHDGEYIHGAIVQEIRVRAGTNAYPWNKSPQTRALFVEFIANGLGVKGSEMSKQQIAESIVRNANFSAPGAANYAKALSRWNGFVKNARSADSIEVLTGKEDNSFLSKFLRERRAARAAGA